MTTATAFAKYPKNTPQLKAPGMPKTPPTTAAMRQTTFKAAMAK